MFYYLSFFLVVGSTNLRSITSYSYTRRSWIVLEMVGLMAMNHSNGEFEPGYGLDLDLSIRVNVAQSNIIDSECNLEWPGSADNYL